MEGIISQSSYHFPAQEKSQSEQKLTEKDRHNVTIFAPTNSILHDQLGGSPEASQWVTLLRL